MSRYKKNRAFTLVEMLTVIVILGIFSTLGIVALTNIRKSQERKFNQTQYDLFKETAKTYFLDNKSLLPTVPNSTNIVYLEDLIHYNYLDSLLDYKKKSYALDSYVEVKKIGINQYFYTVVLRKQGTNEGIKDTSDTDSDKGIIFSKYRKDTLDVNDKIGYDNNTYYTNKTTKINLNISDNEGIMAFCYIVYKNNIIIYTSEYITVGNANDASDTLVLDLNKYGDGTYQIEVVVYDNKDHVKSKKSKSIMIDRVPPTCTTTKSPNLEWTNSKTIIKGTCSDNKGKTKGNSGCQTTSTSEDKSEEGIYSISPGVISDKAGNKTTCDEIPVRIDKTAPTCGTINVSGTKGENDWYISDVSISANNGTDALSGHKSTSVDKTSITTETKGTKVTLTTTDKAGNSCTKEETVKIDKTNPTCGTINVSGTKGDNDWYTSNVTISATDGTDALSGHASTSVDKTSITTDTSGTKVTLTTKDKAGNSCTKIIKDIKIDKTKPTCISSGGSDTWTNDSRTLEGKCSDSGSGCQQNSITRLINYEVNWTDASPGVVYDNAGNYEFCPNNQTVRIDKTPPSCISSGGSTSWTKSSRTLEGKCSDSGSGCQGNVSKVIDTEGSFTNLSAGTVYDNAGNSTECPADQTVKIDRTGPSCSTKGQNKEWTSENITITYTGTDSLVGGVTGGDKITFSTGTTKLAKIPAYEVSDKLGNKTSCPEKYVNVYSDHEPPTCKVLAYKEDGNQTVYTPGNWTAFDVLSKPECSDASGECKTTTRVTVTGASPSHTNEVLDSYTVKKIGISYVTWTVYDIVGHSKTCDTLTVNKGIKSRDSKCGCETYKTCSAAGCATYTYGAWQNTCSKYISGIHDGYQYRQATNTNNSPCTGEGLTAVQKRKVTCSAYNRGSQCGCETYKECWHY